MNWGKLQKIRKRLSQAVHRWQIKCLGNAVVAQVGKYLIGSLLFQQFLNSSDRGY